MKTKAFFLFLFISFLMNNFTFLLAQKKDSTERKRIPFVAKLGLGNVTNFSGTTMTTLLGVGLRNQKYMFNVEYSFARYVSPNLPENYKVSGFLSSSNVEIDKIGFYAVSIQRNFKINKKFNYSISTGLARTSISTHDFIPIPANSGGFLSLFGSSTHQTIGKTETVTGLNIRNSIGYYLGETKSASLELSFLVHLNKVKSFYGLQLVFNMGRLP